MAGASEVTAAFQARYGGTPNLYRAPGRVNLIGEHTDYNQGFVMPIAIELACFAAVRPNDSGKLRVYSANQDDEREFDTAGLATRTPEHHWTDYVVGVAQQLVRAGYEVRGADLALDSTVPLGSGLSSSAAIEVASALALLGGASIDKLELAKLCKRAENEFVGLPSGIMDQYASVFGRAHAALELDCRSLTNEYVSLPDGVSIVAVNTMVKHELGQSAYRDRVRECHEAVAGLQTLFPNVQSLRDATPEQVDEAQERMSPTAFRRARHITTENARVQEFAQACRRGEKAGMGRLFVASHRSLQHDYEVSCEELDFLVDTAVAMPGVFGARMTGGGFGGCTVNLVEPGAVEAFEAGIRRAYQERFRIEPQIYRCEPAAGAGSIS